MDLRFPNRVPRAGIQALGPLHLINGVAPHFRYRAIDYNGVDTWSSWGYGDPLSVVGGGPPIVGYYGPFEEDPVVVGTGLTGSFVAPNNDLGQVLANEDYVLEFVMGYGGEAQVANKGTTSGSPGWAETMHASANTMQGVLYHTASPGSTVHGCSGQSMINHHMRFFRRGGNWVSYGNASESNNGATGPVRVGANPIGDATKPLRFGRTAEAPTLRRTNWYYMAMWKGVGLLANDNHQALVSSRFYALAGKKVQGTP